MVRWDIVLRFLRGEPSAWYIQPEIAWPLEAKAVLSVLSNSAVITSIIPCQKGSDKWDLTSGLAGSENRVLTNGV